MEKVVTHYGETIQQHSVEWYKKQLSKDFSIQFIKDYLLPQLFEWSNAYKAAVELTKKARTGNASWQKIFPKFYLHYIKK